MLKNLQLTLKAGPIYLFYAENFDLPHEKVEELAKQYQGITIPKPTATKKDAAMRIETSRGRSLNGERINRETLLQPHHVRLRTPYLCEVALRVV